MKKKLIIPCLFAMVLASCGGNTAKEMKAAEDKMEKEVEEIADPAAMKDAAMEMQKEATAMEEASKELENAANELDSLIGNL